MTSQDYQPIQEPPKFKIRGKRISVESSSGGFATNDGTRPGFPKFRIMTKDLSKSRLHSNQASHRSNVESSEGKRDLLPPISDDAYKKLVGGFQNRDKQGSVSEKALTPNLSYSNLQAHRDVSPLQPCESGKFLVKRPSMPSVRKLMLDRIKKATD